jgi:hypothetical protein
MVLAAEVVVMLVRKVIQRGEKRRMLAQQGEAGAELHVLGTHLQVYVLGTDADVRAGHCLHCHAMKPSRLKPVVHPRQKRFA